MRIVPRLAAMVAVLVFTDGAAQAAGETRSLRMKFRPGETRRYEMKSSITLVMGGAEKKVGVRAGVEMKVLSVTDAGAAVVELRGKDVRVTPATLPQAEETGVCKAKIDPRGQVRMAVRCAEEDAKLFAMLFASVDMRLPEGPVKPGDSWKVPLRQELPADLPGNEDGTAALRGDAVLTFRELRKVGGRTCAVIHLSAKLGTGPSRGKNGSEVSAGMDGESCFDVDAGDYAWSKLTTTTSLAIVPAPDRRLEAKTTTVSEHRRLGDTPSPKEGSSETGSRRAPSRL